MTIAIGLPGGKSIAILIAILFAKKYCNIIAILFAILDLDLVHAKQHNIQC